MAAVNNFVGDIKRLLRRAIRDKTVLTYSEAWEEFDHVVTSSDRFDTIAEASLRICDYEDAICSAVMSAAGNGLPGNGLYRLMQEYRLNEYSRIAGDTEIEKLTEAQKRALTESERVRVYERFA